MTKTVYPHATAASLAAKAMLDIENHTVEDLVEVLADPSGIKKRRLIALLQPAGGICVYIRPAGGRD